MTVTPRVAVARALCASTHPFRNYALVPEPDRKNWLRLADAAIGAMPQGYLKENITSRDARIAELEATNMELINLLRPYFTSWEIEARGHGEQSSIWDTVHTPVTYQHHQLTRAALQPKGSETR